VKTGWQIWQNLLKKAVAHKRLFANDDDDDDYLNCGLMSFENL
jgi:hypothetical protein